MRCNAAESGVDTHYDPVMLADPRPGSITGFPYARKVLDEGPADVEYSLSETRAVGVLRPPRPGDFGWVVHRHGVLYSREYGWDERFEALVARVVADYADRRGDPRQAGWIAELDGERVGSVFCMPGDDGRTAKLRLLLLEPPARGRGVGKRLVAECVEFARASGYAAIELWTVSLLAAARAIYQHAGFELVSEELIPGFGYELTGQTWRLEL